MATHSNDPDRGRPNTDPVGHLMPWSGAWWAGLLFAGFVALG